MTTAKAWSSWKQANMRFTHFGLDYSNPDLVEHADAYSPNGHSMESTEYLLPLLENCIKIPGVHAIDRPNDYSGNDRLNDELRT